MERIWEKLISAQTWEEIIADLRKLYFCQIQLVQQKLANLA